MDRTTRGVGTYYATYDAQKIFDSFTPEEMGISTVNFENTLPLRDSWSSRRRCG